MHLSAMLNQEPCSVRLHPMMQQSTVVLVFSELRSGHHFEALYKIAPHAYPRAVAHISSCGINVGIHNRTCFNVVNFFRGGPLLPNPSL